MSASGFSPNASRKANNSVGDVESEKVEREVLNESLEVSKSDHKGVEPIKRTE